MERTFIGRRISGIAALAAVVGTLLVLIGGVAPAHAAGDDAEITAELTCDGVAVTSSKDISNIVVSFADGSTERFEGLSGLDWSRVFDREVAGVWVKSGNNKSGDGPGYGEWFASDADCTGAQPSTDQEQPAPEADGADGADDEGRRAKPVRDAPAAPAPPAPAAPDTGVVTDVAADTDERPAAEVAPEADDAVAPAPAAEPAPDTAVLGITVERPVTAAGPEAEVAGLRAEAAPAELASTGADAGWLLALAVALAVYGIIALDLTGRRVQRS